MGGKNDNGLEMANEFLSRSRESPTRPLMVAYRVMGSTLLCIGEFQSAKQHFEDRLRSQSAKENGSCIISSVVEPQAASLLLLSWVLWFLGYPDQSLSRVLEASALGSKSSHTPTQSRSPTT